MMTIEVRSEKDVKKGMTDALFWAGYLKDKEEEIDLFGSLPEGFKKKGGEGSGHYGHSGLPGVWGGSTSSGAGADDSGESWEKFDALWDDEKFEEAMDSVGIGASSGDGVDYELEEMGLSKEELKYMFALPDMETDIDLVGDGQVEIIWTRDGEPIGNAEREFLFSEGVCENHWFSLDASVQNVGIAESLYARQKHILGDSGEYYEIKLEADVSIGRYAWAKEGFVYDESTVSLHALKRNLKSWLGKMEVSEAVVATHSEAIDNFITPLDFANFDIPGVSFIGSDIENRAVKKDYKMHTGKAFMLDRGRHGHGSWNGVYYLA